MQSSLLFLVAVLQVVFALDPQCNGHGSVASNSTATLASNSTSNSKASTLTAPLVCLCEKPYSGDNCELCADGFYGNPEDGGPCFLACPTSLKLLYGFTTAGVGVTSSPGPCLWFVLPPSLAFSPDDIFSLRDLQGATSGLLDHTYSLRFANNLEFRNETVLVYSGLPDSLLNSLSASQLDFTCSSAPDDPSKSWLVSFSDNFPSYDSVGLRAPFLSVLYYYSTKTPRGFTMAITVSESNNGSLVGDEHNTTHSPLDGLYLHSSVFDPCSAQVLVYGGRYFSGEVGEKVLGMAVNVSGGEGEGEEVEVVDSGTLRPEGRYLHTAVLVECSNSSTASRMVVFGGLVAVEAGGQEISAELWCYSNGLWTQLNSVESSWAVAGHAAVLAGDRMIVIGGVEPGWHLSPRVLQYSLVDGSWMELSVGPFGPDGIYGHTAVYDKDRGEVLVFGGYNFMRPSPSPSSKLYSLSVDSLQWRLLHLSSPVPPLVFQAGAVSAGSLVLFGGLTERGAKGGSLFPSNQTVLVLLHGQAALSGEYPAVVFDGVLTPDDSSPRSPAWGASATDVGGLLVVSGGVNTVGRGVGAVWRIAVPRTHNCSSIESLDLCRVVPDCVVCTLKVQNESFVSGKFTCRNSSEVTDDSNCFSPTEQPSECSLFSSCQTCMSSDVAQRLGCKWCVCRGDTRCVLGVSECVAQSPFVLCAAYDITNPEQCLLDVCAIPSCSDCQADSTCNWIGNSFSHELTNDRGLIISDDEVEWGCYSDVILNAINAQLPQANTLVLECPLPCSTASSCRDCVNASRYSPNGGDLHCVWAQNTHQCLSRDVVPFFCSDGLCGTIVTSIESSSTSSPCFQHLFCHSCLQHINCVWAHNSSASSTVGECISLDKLVEAEEDGYTYSYLQCPVMKECSTVSNVCRSDQTCVDLRHGFDCNCPEGYEEGDSQCDPVCLSGCGPHGACASPDNCSCALGYVGPTCGVPCACNGHSDCIDATVTGRATCLNCLHNTQGASCNECQPFSVGVAVAGANCVPCLEHCRGNSDVCLRLSEYNFALSHNISLTREELSNLVLSGSNSLNAICVDCGRNTAGSACETCLEGYFVPNNTNTTSASGCTKCMCNGHGDSCNAFSGEGCNCFNNTQTFCTGGTCYLTQCNQCINGYIGNPTNNTHCYKLQRTNNVITNYTVLANRTVFLVLPPKFHLDTKVYVLVEKGSLDVYTTNDSQAVQVVTGDYGEHVILFNRATLDAKVRKNTVNNRLLIVLSRADLLVNSDNHFFVLFARTESKFFFFFRQDASQLNLPVFIGMFLCSFSLASTFALFGWKVITLLQERARVTRRKNEQDERKSRPYEKVTVFFCPSQVSKADSKERHSMEEPDTRCTGPQRLKPFSPVRTNAVKKTQDVDVATPTPPLSKESNSTELDVRDWSVCPLAYQPTRHGKAVVSSVLVQYPSKCNGSAVGIGSALFHRSNDVAHIQIRNLRSRNTSKVRPNKTSGLVSAATATTSL